MLSFRLFGIPVTIHPSFLLIAVLLGLGSRRLEFVLAWVGIVFVSILIHELGHALTARGFGATVAIELNAIGGLTSWSTREKELGPGRRAIVAAAGSAVGVMFGGLVWLFERSTGPYLGMADFVLDTLVRVNVFWGLLNWAPIRPLDGGHLLASLLQKTTPRNAERIGNVVFMTSALGALAVALWSRRIFLAVLAGWLVMGELSRRRPTRPAMAIPEMNFDDPVGDDAEAPGIDVASDQPEADPDPPLDDARGDAEGAPGSSGPPGSQGATGTAGPAHPEPESEH